MAGEKAVLKNLVFALGGERMSRGTNTFQIPVDRAEVDAAGFEDPGKATEKGPYDHGVTATVFLTKTELYIMQRFQEQAAPVPFVALTESNLLASPAAAVGSAAIFFDTKVTGVPISAVRAALRTCNVKMVSGPSNFYWGKTLFCNVNAAALGAGVTVSTPQNIGTLAAGKQLACGLWVLNPPGVLGVTPSLTAELLSDAAGTFLSPIVRGTFPAMTAPGAPPLIVLDGDLTPLPGETFWAIRLTVSGTTPGFTVIAALELLDK